MHYRRYYKARSDIGRKMARARWDRENARIEAEMPERLRYLAETRANNYPANPGDILGTLQWTDAATGKVRRWIIRIGDRRDQITAETPDGRRTRSRGWTWFLEHLRGYLAGTKQ